MGLDGDAIVKPVACDFWKGKNLLGVLVGNGWISGIGGI